jgi:DNA repair exonuclease SbcCD ATPase subunit
MINNGIMQDIRNLLSQGNSSAEVIALGYKPPTVYKVQRQLRCKQPNGRAPLQLMDQNQSITAREGQDELSAEDAEFFRCFFEPGDESAQSEAMRAELDEARDRIEELERETGKNQALQERVHTLEVEAEATVALRRRVQELEDQLKNAVHTQVDLRQSNAQWQTKFQEERSAREQAERQVRDHQDQASQWQQAYQIVNSQLEASAQVIDNLRIDLRKLEPLKAWAGHPCSVCHKPMSGSVDRALAARMTQDLAHKGCLEKRGAGLGKVLLAGGTLLGLSQLGKKS